MTTQYHAYDTLDSATPTYQATNLPTYLPTYQQNKFEVFGAPFATPKENNHLVIHANITGDYLQGIAV